MAHRPVTIALTLLLFGTLLSACQGKNASPGTERIVIAGQTFQLEIASDTDSITLGLMNRKTIPPGTGMIFIFPDAQVRGFWMKNCLTDIDLIYLDPRGFVTSIHRMKAESLHRDDETVSQYERRLKTYSSGRSSQFAIELPSGSLDQLNVRFEDKIELDLVRLKALVR